MCGGWLILSPVAGALLAAMIYESDWRRPRKTDGGGWVNLGFFAGLAFMFVYLITFCGPPK
jgi:hypothetical protein